MWNIWWNLGVRLFDLPGKHQKIQGEFRGKILEKFQKLRFNFRVFFGNFVQQKGGVDTYVILLRVLRKLTPPESQYVVLLDHARDTENFITVVS